MDALFEVGPIYDKHADSIVKLLLSKLSNNNPKKDSKCYMRTINIIMEIYKGTFLTSRRFDESKNKQFNMDNVFKIIAECANDWSKVRKIISDSLDHLEQAKQPDKMPFNKKYLNNITFSRLFNNGYNQDGLIDCPFLKFINPPKDSYSFTSDITISKLKENTSSLIRQSAEKYCKKFFKMKSYQLSFWYDMEDWTRWLKNMKETFPDEYNEFLLSCKNGNPLDDYTDYLINSLKSKQGSNPIIERWYYQLSYKDGNELDGYFKRWLITNINNGRFSAFRNLPKSINYYYLDESFDKSEIKVEKKKETIDLDDMVIW